MSSLASHPRHLLVIAASLWAACSSSGAGIGASLSSGGTSTLDTVFAEGFESGTFAGWDDRGRAANQAIVTTEHRSGARALEVTFPLGADGGWLTKFFLPGYDSIYASYWVKLQPGWLSGTKMLTLFGSQTGNQWSAAGTAGRCPNGRDFFILAVVMERTATPGGPTHFYDQYPAGPRTPAGSATCWGHDGVSAGATYTGPATIAPGSWHHVEYWAKLNTPGQSNSVQRLCIDGVLRGTWTGISLRDSTVLRLNALTISNSIANGSPQLQRLWADDVLVMRQRPATMC